MLKYRWNITYEMSLTNNYLLFPSVSKTECGNTGSRQYLHIYFTKPLKYIMNNKY